MADKSRKPPFRHEMPHLEMHINHHCNLNCQYCAHFCEYGYGGAVPYEIGARWIRSWSERLAPKLFHLLGGEPLLHPDAGRYVTLLAERFPDAERTFVTNGILLPKREELLPVLIQTRTALSISLHSLHSGEQAAQLNRGLKLALQYKAKGLRVEVLDTTQKWLKIYQGEGRFIKPFADGDPETSWKNCSVGHSPILQDGKVWKCPPLAFLPQIIGKLETKALWEPYLAYKPLELHATDDEIEAFIAGESHCCGMCPAHPQPCDVGQVPEEVFEGLLPVRVIK